MTEAPPVTSLDWPEAHRIISSRYPPVSLFEDIADPQDWDLIAGAESKTNPRLAESVGRLDLVPPGRRVAGPGASLVMAPFTHVSPDWAGRFHDGTFGAYYAANRFETSVAETAFHRGRFFRASRENPGWLTQLRHLIGSVNNDFHDLRRAEKFRDCLDPDSYNASQALARRLRSDGANGLVYPSVRDPEGEVIAAFWPNVVGVPAPARHLAYHFDGERIDLVRDEADGDVWRIV